MLTIDEALTAVLERAVALPPRSIPVNQAFGLVLAEDIVADMDQPPFTKSLVDGFAVRSSDLADGNTRLTVGEEIVAGKTPTRPLATLEAAVIMTGAPLPPEADAVVMVEKTRRDGNFVAIEDAKVTKGQGVLPRGREMKEDDVVLTRGRRLNAPALGLVAAVGRSEVRVHPRPKVAVVTTGDELVDPSQKPGPGQIRNSNATLLRALATNECAVVEVYPNAPDEIEALKETLTAGLASDVLVITGGVSAGNRDLVPEALQSLGVKRVFHKIRLKPGKPLWFGVGPKRTNGLPGSLVFGLPGNPVSGIVGFLLFVRPALRRLADRKHVMESLVTGRLRRAFRHRGDRPTYYPAISIPTSDPALLQIELLDWGGSADLRTVAWADGFAIFPEGDRDYEAGEIVGFLPLD